MTEKHFDVLVVGAGPAGSVAALVLARAGARVALVDKAAFPRDKACGDLIGPRGVQVLRDLAIDIPGATQAGDMIVVGPTGNRVRLPARPGQTYPGYALVVPRSAFDATLQRAAIDAGAMFFDCRADEAIYDDCRLAGFALSSGARLEADVIVGADGATSRVADAACLVEPRRVLWGFAVRTYLEGHIEEPHIMLWTPSPGAAFPGYGWVFPAGDGRVNVGLGVGVLSDRTAGRRASRDFEAFLDHATRMQLLEAPSSQRSSPRLLGAWLKMGLVGTTPGRARTLLVGDAAGLVNPLQGEGIAQAMDSGRAAAAAILAGVDQAADVYVAHVGRTYGAYFSTTATVHRSLLRTPKRVARLNRALTAPGVGRALAGGWSIAWNDLREGARSGAARSIASAAAGVGSVLTAASSDRSWIRAHTKRAERTKRPLVALDAV
jgi:geranylgeranyl reductase family protein